MFIELLTILQTTFARLLLCSSSSKNCVLMLSSRRLVGFEKSRRNLLFVSKKVDLVDLELFAVDLVDLK